MARQHRALVRLVGPFTVAISGLAYGGLPVATWRKVLNAMGVSLQQEIANAFSKQRTAAGWLVANKPSYTAQKARQGYDTRRGHRTNTLQSLLRPEATKLFVVRGPYKNGNARIIFRENLLHSVVGYSKYYEENKVRGAGILQLSMRWVREYANLVHGANIAAEAAQGASISVAGRRAAPFAGRPARIKPTMGLTSTFMLAIGASAFAAVSTRKNKQTAPDYQKIVDNVLRKYRRGGSK